MNPAVAAGCLNGGGQVKPAKGQTVHQLIDQLDSLYHSPEVQLRLPEQSPVAAALYEQWVGDSSYSAAAQELLHTQYHKREKTLTATVGDW